MQVYSINCNAPRKSELLRFWVLQEIHSMPSRKWPIVQVKFQHSCPVLPVQLSFVDSTSPPSVTPSMPLSHPPMALSWWDWESESFTATTCSLTTTSASLLVEGTWPGRFVLLESPGLQIQLVSGAHHQTSDSLLSTLSSLWQQRNLCFPLKSPLTTCSLPLSWSSNLHIYFTKQRHWIPSTSCHLKAQSSPGLIKQPLPLMSLKSCPFWWISFSPPYLLTLFLK